MPPIVQKSAGSPEAWARNVTIPPFLPHKVVREDRPDGTILLKSGYDLPEAARCTGEWIDRWAKEAPERVAVSARGLENGSWRDVTYQELRAQVRAVAASLLERGLGQTDRIAILSGNGIEHLLLALGAQYVGVPVVQLAEQYALIEGAQRPEDSGSTGGIAAPAL